MSGNNHPILTGLLMQWYDQKQRRLPWRALPGARADPYHVWLSEIMLQQTTIATVRPYYEAFLQRWPTLKALASAPLEDILHAWQGLGYYTRARNLHRCAQVLINDYQGQFPQTAHELRTLPGIGEYTAGAIAAIAFNKAVVAIDGNVIRVGSRLFAIDRPYPSSLPAIKDVISKLIPYNRPGDFAQALMDLGSQVCTPKQPSCEACPVVKLCEGWKQGVAEQLPVKKKTSPLPTRHTFIFWAVREADGAVLIQRRPEKGLLGGLYEFPSTPWQEKKIMLKEAEDLAPFETRWTTAPGIVTHTFSHFHLEMRVLKGFVTDGGDSRLLWRKPSDFIKYAFPTVMKKVLRHVERVDPDKIHSSHLN